jgi:hypothetical protein
MSKQQNNEADEVAMSRAEMVEIDGSEEALEAAMEVASSIDSIADSFRGTTEVELIESAEQGFPEIGRG